MTLYLDTSVLVSALTNEARAADIQAWLEAKKKEQFAISEWVIAEFSSALSIKLRNETLDLTERAAALAAFREFTEASFAVSPIHSVHLQTAARFADLHELGLRAADALHLAVCAGYAATLCTLDRRMAQAGNALGIATLLL